MNNFTNLSPEELINNFSTSRTGLSPRKAHELLKKYGFNELAIKQITWFTIFKRQFISPFIWLLMGAAVISTLLGNFIDAGTILVIILLNTALGFYQEFKAQNTLDLLKNYVQPQALVIRDEHEQLVATRLLVPGDIVVVDPGDFIPADIQFIEEHNLMIDESLLSGEAAPIKKTSEKLQSKASTIFDAHNMGFSGTVVVSGKGKGVVVATGMQTELGTIGKLTFSRPQESPFYKNIRNLSSYILKIIIVTATLLFVAHLILRPAGISPFNIIMFIIALAIGITPEALPAVSTFSLSQGALLLAKHKVFVKRLSAIEDLGSIDVLCTDKTGTLTKNELTIVDMYGEEKKNLFYLALASTSQLVPTKEPLHPFDKAAWQKLKSEDFEKLAHYETISTLPFEPQHRRTLILVKGDNQHELIVRGAHEEILKRSTSSDKEKEKIEAWVQSQAVDARRMVAIARKKLTQPSQNLFDDEKKLEFIGLIAFDDPIKRSVVSAITKAQNLGVEIKILTGDSPEIAGAVARRIGLIFNATEVITHKEFESYNEKEKTNAVLQNRVFARVTPEQKYEIIQILQEEGKHVAYLGDGINDAPSLAAAHVGIVVQCASDIAREAADIVLLQKSLNSIIDGIKIGRRIFHNTLNYLKITLASNFGNFYSIAIVSLFIDFLPMLPLQILLVNILSDIPMLALATDNVDPEELQIPTKYDLKTLTWFALLFGIISSLFDGIFFRTFYHASMPAILQTNWFILSIITEIFFIFSGRTNRFFLKAKRPSTRLILLSGVTILITIAFPYTILGQKIFHFYTPTLHTLGIIGLLGIGYFITCEIAKQIYYNANSG